jgi:hypothetical protein
MGAPFGQSCARIVLGRAFLKKHRITTEDFDKTGKLSGRSVRAKLLFTSE